MAAPLSDLLSSTKEFIWTQEHEEAFRDLCTALTTAPVLALPDFTLPFAVACDASVIAVGAELSQRGRPIAFYSKKLQPAERRYHVTDREMLAVY